MYRIASRITSSCETLSLTHTDGTSSFNLNNGNSTVEVIISLTVMGSEKST